MRANLDEELLSRRCLDELATHVPLLLILPPRSLFFLSETVAVTKLDEVNLVILLALQDDPGLVQVFFI